MWDVKESHNHEKIIVTCSLTGDIFYTFRVEVKPFDSIAMSSGEDYDFSSEITMKVEKEFSPNKNVANYKCTLEKDLKELVTFYFRVKNIMVIERI